MLLVHSHTASTRVVVMEETTPPPPTHPGGGGGGGGGGHHAAGIFTFAFVASALVLFCVLRALKYFSAKTNPLSVKTQVFLSWTLSVSILTLVPLDVGYSLNRTNDDEGRERTNDGRDVGIDVLVDVFSHLGDFTVAPDLRGQVLDNNFSVMSRIFTWAVVEYISVSPSKPIFNRSVLLCRPCLRRGVLTTFLLS